MIKLLILDIDGIMTEGNKLYDRSGLCKFKFFNDKDWTAIKLFRCHDVDVCFLTGDDFNLDIAKNRNIDCFLNKDNISRTIDGPQDKRNLFKSSNPPKSKNSKFCQKKILKE